MTTPRGSLRNFLEESPFHEFLESCWNGSYYLNFPVSSGNPAYDPGGVCAHALYYLCLLYTSSAESRTSL